MVIHGSNDSYCRGKSPIFVSCLHPISVVFTHTGVSTVSGEVPSRFELCSESSLSYQHPPSLTWEHRFKVYLKCYHCRPSGSRIRSGAPEPLAITLDKIHFLFKYKKESCVIKNLL